MNSATEVYGLDIETDTSGEPVDGIPAGLDPRNGRITEIAVAVEGGGEVFADADEFMLLGLLDEYLRTLRPGLLVTWNGSNFDLPYISDRAGINGLYRKQNGFGLQLFAQPALEAKYDYLPGHETGYSGVWQIGGAPAWRHNQTGQAVHQHLDVAYAYRSVAEEAGVRWGLKPVCRGLGIDMYSAAGQPFEDPALPGEVDRNQMHLMTPEQRRAYSLSDAEGTRALAIRLLGADRTRLKTEG